jgi:hypothetical protein
MFKQAYSKITRVNEESNIFNDQRKINDYLGL